MKKVNLKSLGCYLGCTLILGSTIAFTNPTITQAEEIRVESTQLNRENFSDEIFYKTIILNIEGEDVPYEVSYRKYVANKNDNLSSISRKMCKELYGIDEKEFVKQTGKYTTLYWPTIAFSTGKTNDTIKAGDVLLCPATEEDAEALLEHTKATGWYAKFVTVNRIYEAARRKGSTLRQVIEEICRTCYGMEPTDEFVERYARYQANHMIDPKNAEFFRNLDYVLYLPEDQDKRWLAGELLPSLEDMGYNIRQK